jgi:hypothetical protein
MSKKYHAVRLRAQDRLRWVDTMANDPKLKPMAFKVAAKIGSHFNSITGETYGAQEKLSHWMGIGERTIRRAISDLVSLGYLIVIAPEADNFLKSKDKRRSNTYQPAINCVRLDIATSALIANDNFQSDTNATAISSPDGGAANENDPAFIKESEFHEAHLSSSAETSCGSCEGQERPPAGVASRSEAEKHEVAGGLSTLNDPSDQYPSSPPGEKPEHDDDLLRKFVNLLPTYVGNENTHWLKDITAVNMAIDAVVFAVSNKFIEDWFKNRFQHQVLDCVKRFCPAVTRVEFVSKSKPSNRLRT